ncbi:hypothetical protein CMI42_02015 [Candidatus Pacearchaeota archaeon]|nr:hypothetical protein [Candidatus Pacearchaeota archaeon]|tara:strand:- start:1680 stop:2465 length:786 start_codon:yes stop_codon:yes gene_type:complete
MELIKPTRKLGNAAGVLLPKELANSLVKIEIIDYLLDEIDLMKLLREYIDLNEIIGVYLVGGYARGDYDNDSDVDVLVISGNVDLEINKDKYQITIIPKEVLDQQKGYPLYYHMINEAKPVLNEYLLNSYRKDLKLSINGIKEYIKATKKMIKKAESHVRSKNSKNGRTDDAVAYSLILRLRGLYLLDCVDDRKKSSKNGLLSLIKSLTSSLDMYDRYNAIKNNKKLKEDSIEIGDAQKVIDYLKEGLEKWEEIIKEEGRF